MISYEVGALEYISKLCDGHLRDAITMLDKCLSYCGGELSVENVVKALGVSNSAEMFKLTFAVYDGDEKQAIDIIEDLYNTGIDIKIFVKQYIQFLLDVVKYSIGCDWSKLQIPKLKDTTESLNRLAEKDYIARTLLSYMVNLNADIKYSQTAKYDFEVAILSAISEVIE